MTGIVERRPGVSFEILEARVILTRKLRSENPEIARIAGEVLSDPGLFARFVELRRCNRTARLAQAVAPERSKAPWYYRMVSWLRGSGA